MRYLFLLAVLCCFFSSASHASIEVAANSPRLISLNQDAASVIIGNPDHASVALDNPRLLIVSAGIPGITTLTVLDRNGRVIMNEDIIVNGPASGNIRIQNACINSENDGCQTYQIFKCPEGGRCHNMAVRQPTTGGGEGGGSAGGSGGGGGDNLLGEDFDE